MNMSKTLILKLCGLCLLGLLGCNDSTNTPNATGPNPTGSAADKGEVIVDGSSSVGPVTEVAVEAFAQVPDSASVPVSKSGTGAGFKKFVTGSIDICDASRPITEDEMKKCAEAGIKYYELPICYDALTIVIHPENTWAETMSVEQLRKLWIGGADGSGEIQTWDQIDPSWPKEKISLFGAGDASGTYDYFREAIADKKHRTDYSPSENDNLLVKGVADSKFALGYIPYTYYAGNKDKLKAVKVTPEGGTEGVEPSTENALSGKYTPLSRPLFIYVNAASAERPEVQKFVEFYLKGAKEFAEKRSYLPLSMENYGKTLKRFQEKQTGTVFGGTNEIGITADDLFVRELVE